jgi:hypothetical protein
MNCKDVKGRNHGLTDTHWQYIIQRKQQMRVMDSTSSYTVHADRIFCQPAPSNFHLPSSYDPAQGHRYFTLFVQPIGDIGNVNQSFS